jgi:hypothetical protein
MCTRLHILILYADLRLLGIPIVKCNLAWFSGVGFCTKSKGKKALMDNFCGTIRLKLPQNSHQNHSSTHDIWVRNYVLITNMPAMLNIIIVFLLNHYDIIECNLLKTKPWRGAVSVVTKFSIFLMLFTVNSCAKITHFFLVGFYQNLYHHASNVKFSISHRTMFSWINRVEKCTRSFPRYMLRQCSISHQGN